MQKKGSREAAIQNTVSWSRKLFLLHWLSIDRALSVFHNSPVFFHVSIQISVFQITILKGEVLLFPLAPSFIIEVDVSSLFILICDGLGLLVSLKPHHILGMESPGLLFQRFGSEKLSFGSLRT